MSPSIPSPHGPSRSRPESPSPETELPTEESDDFRINFSIPGPSSPGQQVASEEGDEGGEEDRLDIKLIQGFAEFVFILSGSSHHHETLTEPIARFSIDLVVVENPLEQESLSRNEARRILSP
jgi:hypothetical protein